MKHGVRLVTVLVLTLVGYVILFGNAHVWAQVMQSSSFQIESDSVNFGGGLASSTNYQAEDTLGEIATGRSDSSSFSLRAGYQQMQEVYIAMSAAPDVVMSSGIGGITGGTSTGSTTVTVTTDNLAGYQLSISAENSPAMQDGTNTIADYDDEGTPDFSFLTQPTDAHLAYTPEGVDVVDGFKDNGALCGVGSLETADACWDGLTTSPVAIASGLASNHPSGATTTVKFQVGIGSSVNQPEGVYVATTTLTLLPL